MRQIAADLLLTAVLIVSDDFPGSQGTVVILPVQLHRAAVNLDPGSHNDSAGTRGVLIALQEEGLALCTCLDPLSFQLCFDLPASLPTQGSVCLSISCSPFHTIILISNFLLMCLGFFSPPPTRIQSTVKHL